MNKRIFHSVSAAALLAALISLTSCLSTGPKQTPDEKAVARGVQAWNKRQPSAAKPYWSTIKDPALKDKYLGYVDKAAAADAALANADAELEKPKPSESKLAASYDTVVSSYSSIPKELPPPSSVKKRALPLAERRVRGLVKAEKFAAAKETGKKAVDLFGADPAIDSMLKEVEIVEASRKGEGALDASLAKARGTEDFDEKVAAYSAAAADCDAARSSLLSKAKSEGVADSSIVAAQSLRLKQRRQEIEVEQESMIRDKAYEYRDKIGEEFARVPEGKDAGSMKLEQILEYQQSVRANVDAAYKDLLEFAKKYPDAIDPDFLDEVAAQKKDLDAKIAQVEAEIRTAKEIASRGKVVFPIIIGLFNPQPGSKDEAKKSRPAVFSAEGAKKPEYWWGMYSIPRGTMNDLVITLKDGRGVRAFGSNTKSGKIVGKDNPDLINKGSKIGNSWPVLNAGARFPTDKYFFEIDTGKDGSYEGEVVIYSSFVVRMR